MDVLTELIDTLRLRGTAYCRTELTAPWGMALPASDLAHFHVVQQGACWIQLDDEPSALFYSKKPGSGNQVRYDVVLPRDPSPANPTAPRTSVPPEITPPPMPKSPVT